jgi:hypothetical protein
MYSSDLEMQEEFSLANKVCRQLFLSMGNGLLKSIRCAFRVRSKVPVLIAIGWRIMYNTTASLSNLDLPRLALLENVTAFGAWKGRYKSPYTARYCNSYSFPVPLQHSFKAKGRLDIFLVEV